MSVDLTFVDHPYILGVQVSRLLGYSILRGWMLSSKYEVKDLEGEIHHFDTDESLREYLKEVLGALD